MVRFNTEVVMRRFFLALVISLTFTCSHTLVSEQEAESIFSKIYQSGKWSRNELGEGTSGPGSSVNQALPYMKFLEQFLREKKIKSVIDIGCGDWEFSQFIDWGDVHYTGYDVVESVIQKDKKLYGSDRIKFVKIDILNQEIPKADLLLCKDVFMHLPNESIIRVLNKTNHIKYCLFTSCTFTPGRPGQNMRLNQDISLGGFRLIDLAKPPFEARGSVVFRYKSGFFYKDVFLIEH